MTKPTAIFEPLRIRSIVVPLDGSAFAEQALPWALAIAGKARAKLRLVLVHQLPSPPPLDETTARLYTRWEMATKISQRDYLRRQAARIKAEHSLQAVTALLAGTPAEALAPYIKEIGADLVVMTTHGRGGLQRLWLGSMADRLVRSLDIPMLLIGPSEATGSRSEPAVRQILVPLDGSRRAEAVLPAALALARLFGSTITLLQAVYPVALACDPPTSFPPELDRKLTVIQRREAQDYLDGLAERMTEAGVPTTAAAVVGGSAFEVIQAAAQSPGTGIVAIASRGRGGVSRLMLGSVADKLVRAGDHPILLTRERNK